MLVDTMLLDTVIVVVVVTGKMIPLNFCMAFAVVVAVVVVVVAVDMLHLDRTAAAVAGTSNPDMELVVGLVVVDMKPLDMEFAEVVDMMDLGKASEVVVGKPFLDKAFA